MNTGSRDEQQMLNNIRRIAVALEHISASLDRIVMATESMADTEPMLKDMEEVKS